MGNNSVPKFIFRLSRFPVYRGSVLGRFYCTSKPKLHIVMEVRQRGRGVRQWGVQADGSLFPEEMHTASEYEYIPLTDRITFPAAQCMHCTF